MGQLKNQLIIDAEYNAGDDYTPSAEEYYGADERDWMLGVSMPRYVPSRQLVASLVKQGVINAM